MLKKVKVTILLNISNDGLNKCNHDNVLIVTK